MRIVLDTNVLVAALRSRLGASFDLLTRIGEREVEIAVSVPLVLEYEAVLLRHGSELGVSATAVGNVLDFLCSIAHRQEVHFLWRPRLRDPGDEMVLELAANSASAAIVTFNARDFEPAAQFGIRVLSPAALISNLRGTK